MRVLRDLLNQRSQFAHWWHERLVRAVGTPSQNDWLRIGAECEAAAGIACAIDEIDLSDGAAELFLNTGLVPEAGSNLESALLDAVLRGECRDVSSIRSLPSQIAVALAPGAFYTTSKTGFVDGDERSKRRRSEALNQLRKANSPFNAIARLRAFKVGQKGSTFPWDDTAAALYEHTTGCWLATEVAIIGAASPFALAYTKRDGASAFGAKSHPSELIAQTRSNRENVMWWQQQLVATETDEDRAAWALALWSVASGTAIARLSAEIEHVYSSLDRPKRLTFQSAAEQVARSGWLRSRPVATVWTVSDLAALGAMRDPTDENQQQPEAAPARHDAEPSLLSVARTGSWLKVDARPTYR